MNIIKQLYSYSDYRSFMKDYFSEMKQLKEFFSFRYFAAKAGFKSPNFCYYVINGSRNLSPKSLKKVISAMGLKGKDAAYFEVLVQYNQTEAIKDRDEFFNKLENIRKSSSMKVLGKDMSEYTSHWYYPVLRELVVYSDWKEDYAKLASMVYPKIKTSEAKGAVQKLLELNMIVKNEDGTYLLADTFVSLNGIPIDSKQTIRQEILHKGYEALENLPPNKRYASYSTLSLTESEYEEVTEYLTTMRKQIVADAVSPKPEKVYQLILQLFPVGEIEQRS